MKGRDIIASVEWLTTLATLLTCFVFLFYQIQDVKKEVSQNNLALNTRIDQSNIRIDQVNVRIDQFNERMDQMYTVLLKALEKGK